MFSQDRKHQRPDCGDDAAISVNRNNVSAEMLDLYDRFLVLREHYHQVVAEVPFPLPGAGEGDRRAVEVDQDDCLG